MTLAFDLLNKKSIEVFLGSKSTQWHVLRHCRLKDYIKSNYVDMMQFLILKSYLDHRPFYPKITKRSLSLYVKFHNCMTKRNGVVVQKWYEVHSLQLTLTFRPKDQGPPQSMVKTCVKYHNMLCQKATEWSCRNPLSADRQTTIMKPVSPSTQLLRQEGVTRAGTESYNSP